jgi:hypothetical protein
MYMALDELWFGHIASVCGKDDFMVWVILEVSGSGAVGYCGQGFR